MNLSDSPPAFILVAPYDLLRDEGLLYASALETQGVKVRYKIYEGMVNGFFTMPGVLHGAAEALKDVKDAIEAAL